MNNTIFKRSRNTYSYIMSLINGCNKIPQKHSGYLTFYN